MSVYYPPCHLSSFSFVLSTFILFTFPLFISFISALIFLLSRFWIYFLIFFSFNYLLFRFNGFHLFPFISKVQLSKKEWPHGHHADVFLSCHLHFINFSASNFNFTPDEVLSHLHRSRYFWNSKSFRSHTVLVTLCSCHCFLLFLSLLEWTEIDKHESD